MKTFAKIIISIFSTFFLGGVFSVALGVGLGVTIPVLMGAGAVLSVTNTGAAFAGLYPEVWTGELLKKFRHEGTFLSRISDYSRYVNQSNTMHLVDVGVDPSVLINNTTYPIASSESADSDVSISLSKFDTENTVITDDELRGLSYDKIGLKVEQHKLALEDKTLEKALHSLAVTANSATTPVIGTTGSSNGETEARKRMTINDIISLKRKLDDLKVPKMGRELILCSQHVEDLLLASQTFRDQYHNIKDGTTMDMCGFIVSECTYNPVYTSGTKAAFGAAAAAATDQNASVAILHQRCVKATGEVKAYLREAKNDPEYRRNTVGYRMYHVCLPKKTLGFGAIISTVV